MQNLYIERAIEPIIRRAVKEFPAMVITGPRQSGKTTLLRHLFSKKYRAYPGPFVPLRVLRPSIFKVVVLSKPPCEIAGMADIVPGS